MQCAPTERLQILLCPRVDEGIDPYRVHAASINKPGSQRNPVLYYYILQFVAAAVKHLGKAALGGLAEALV